MEKMLFFSFFLTNNLNHCLNLLGVQSILSDSYGATLTKILLILKKNEAPTNCKKGVFIAKDLVICKFFPEVIKT